MISTHCHCPATANLIYTIDNGSVQLKKNCLIKKIKNVWLALWSPNGCCQSFIPTLKNCALILNSNSEPVTYIRVFISRPIQFSSYCIWFSWWWCSRMMNIFDILTIYEYQILLSDPIVYQNLSLGIDTCDKYKIQSK